MLVYRGIFSFLLLCIVSVTLCKPTENEVTEGRGIGSTLWGWITYPFSWWSSSEEKPPLNEQLIGSTTLGQYEDIEIGRRNVTVWCNEQTCTTMRCDMLGCKNTTCNIYDTDINGECREYITKPDEFTTEPVSKPNSHNTVADNQQQKPTTPRENPTTKPSTGPVPVITVPLASQAHEERPLELEAVLSSTVADDHQKEQHN